MIFVDSKSKRVDEFESANKCRDIRSSASMLDRSSAVAVFHGLPLYGEIYRALFAFSPPPLALLPLSIPRCEAVTWEKCAIQRNARGDRESRKAFSSQYRETHSSLWNTSGGRAQTEEGGKMIVIRKRRRIRKEIIKEICFGKSNVLWITSTTCRIYFNKYPIFFIYFKQKIFISIQYSYYSIE